MSFHKALAVLDKLRSAGAEASRKKWVLPGTFLSHGHCAPRSASSYEILNLIDTLYLTAWGAESPEAAQRKGLWQVGRGF